jgi:predicted MFS family arabinose efflux permease
LCSGIGTQMWVVILGRAISGMGGAGTMTISSIIITDIVPKREVATWRAYVNIAMTLGRSLGGPLGGWLSDTIGWRWYVVPNHGLNNF